jgi:hypothetical protein
MVPVSSFFTRTPRTANLARLNQSYEFAIFNPDSILSKDSGDRLTAIANGCGLRDVEHARKAMVKSGKWQLSRKRSTKKRRKP